MSPDTAGRPLSELLAPYVSAPHPNLSGADPSQAEIIAAMAEVVNVEGPMLAGTLMRVIHTSLGHRRLKKPSDQPYLTAIGLGVKRGHLCTDGEPEDGATVWAVNSPPIVVRELGTRGLFAVPRSELAVVAFTCANPTKPPLTDEQLVRAVLDTYGLKKATTKATARILDVRHDDALMAVAAQHVYSRTE